MRGGSRRQRLGLYPTNPDTSPFVRAPESSRLRRRSGKGSGSDSSSRRYQSGGVIEPHATGRVLWKTGDEMRSAITPGRRLAVLACLLQLAACAIPARPTPPRTGPLTTTLYVIDRGWHTDIGLSADDVTGVLLPLKQRFPGARYLTFGFGEREFLTAREVTVGETLRALLPSRSAMLITTLRASPEAALGPGNVVSLRVTPDGLARLEYTLWHGIERTPADQPVSLGAGPYAGSEFFAALGTYDAFNTCNTWTATMLATAGLPVSAGGVLFAYQVMDQARAVARQQSSINER